MKPPVPSPTKIVIVPVNGVSDCQINDSVPEVDRLDRVGVGIDRQRVEDLELTSARR